MPPNSLGVAAPPAQVGLLNAEHNPDMMLLAARALTFMADAMPASCSAIARHGAVPIFCARLLTIEYIDLAEQSLQVCDGSRHFGCQQGTRQQRSLDPPLKESQILEKLGVHCFLNCVLDYQRVTNYQPVVLSLSV